VRRIKWGRSWSYFTQGRSRPVAYAAAMNAIQQELSLPRWGRAPVDQTKVETALVRVAPGERLLDVAKALKLGASTIRRECGARAAAPLHV